MIKIKINNNKLEATEFSIDPEIDATENDAAGFN